MSETTRPAPETRQKIIDALCESFARDEMEIGELEKRLETGPSSGDCGPTGPDPG